MSKKINAALTDLIKALSKHGEVMGSSPVSAKQAARATAKVRAAAIAYGAAVETRSGQPSLFANLADPSLNEDTIASLTAERDSLEAMIAGFTAKNTDETPAAPAAAAE